MNPSPRQIWDAGIAAQKAGRFAEAQNYFRQLLTVLPNNPDALHMLGIATIEAGQTERAITYISRAVSLNPKNPDYHSNLAAALVMANQPDQAIFAGRRALELRPDFSQAHFNLGKALQLKNRLDEAIACFQRAISLKPDDYGPWVYLAAAFQTSGRYAQAIEAHRRAIALSPNDWATINNLGICLLQTGQLEPALNCFQSAIALNPTHIEAHANLIFALQRLTRLPEAIAAGQRAIAIRQDHAETFNNLANALKELGRAEEAIPLYQKAIALRPTYAQAISNLAIAFHDLGQLEESLTAYRQAIAADPSFTPARWNYGLGLLKLGRFRQGWTEYECRFRAHEVRQPGSESGAPLWDGTPLNGRRILLHGEQGFGDMIQFLRYIPQVAAAGGKIILQAQPEVIPLLRDFPNIDQLAEVGQPPPPCDVHSPLLSLPRIFDTTLETVPSQVPYLRPGADLLTQWKSRLEAPERRIGLVWAGRALHAFNPRYQRSIPLPTLLGALANIPNLRLYALQTGRSPADAEALRQSNVTDLSADLTDFAQTAAAMCNLDLIISIDTAAAHLAGALARPVWVLLPLVADWRWMVQRDDSPWYPTMRLFRQQSPGDWSLPLKRVSDALSAWPDAAKTNPPPPPAQVSPAPEDPSPDR